MEKIFLDDDIFFNQVNINLYFWKDIDIDSDVYYFNVKEVDNLLNWINIKVFVRVLNVHLDSLNINLDKIN